MLHFCCSGGCINSSDGNEDISFHCFPLNDKKRLNIWITKMKQDPRFFTIRKHMKICSVHFSKNDFIDPLAKVKRLKATAVPSRFKWTTPSCEQQEEVEQARQALKKFESCRVQAEEATDTASEGEGDVLFPEKQKLLSRKTQTFGEYFDDEVDRLPCLHAFSL
eukprot:gene7394-13147_t